jgi:hypothetical protein
VTRRRRTVTEDAFDAAVDAARQKALESGDSADLPKCQVVGPGPYQDFVLRPTRQEAEEMCEGCPISQSLCLTYGKKTNSSGIWGATLLDDGKRADFAVTGQGGRRYLAKDESDEAIAA